MIGTPGRGGRARSVRLAATVVLMFSSLAAGPTGAASGPDPQATGNAGDAGRIVYAGTEHRSIGRVTGRNSSEPFFGPGPAHFDQQSSAHGDQLVFTSLRDGTKPQVYLRGADGGVRMLTTDRDAAHPRLSPDGRSVVFDSAEPGGPGGATQRDLWLVHTDGSGLTRLTDTAVDEVSPTISPDGTQIAYSCNGGPTGRWGIYRRGLSGGPLTPVTGVLSGDATEPVWNPVDDAEHRDLIAYTLDISSGTGDTPRSAAAGPAYPTDVDETDLRLRVTDQNGSDEPLLGGDWANWRTRSADWLPDGTGILFLSPDHTCSCTTDFDHVYRTQAHSSDEPTVILDENRAVDSPTWLGDPTGGGVIVTRTSAPTRDTATLQDVRADGADPRDLALTILREDPAAYTNTDPGVDPLFQPGPEHDPWTERQNYTPDGRQIVVTRFEGGKDAPGAPPRTERIWLTDADGANPHPMELAGHGPADRDTDPAFSPDGRLLAFTRWSPGSTGASASTSRVLIADVTTGAITTAVQPPDGESSADDAQPAWSPDGDTLAFTRTEVINEGGGNKHIWTAPINALDEQRDLSAAICPGSCEVIDDSPAFSPDGTTLAFNRKDGGGRVDPGGGVLITQVNGDGCQVLLPAAARGNPNACAQELPGPSGSGPFQPRDVAWSADGSQLLLSARRAQPPNSPEALATYDLSGGELTWLTTELPGRQKEPGVQQSVDLAVSAPATTPPVEVGSSTPVTVTLTNRGPAPSPRTELTAAPPQGLRIDELADSTGQQCDTATARCAVGVLAPGASVQFTARVTGLTEGEQQIGWSVAGAVVDPNPTDNAADTVVPVGPTAPTPPPPPPPNEPEAGPGVHLAAQPGPGFVGGRVVVTYTVRNGGHALATGLRLKLGLPKAVPHDPLPAGCSGLQCTLGDLKPGASSVIRVVLKPEAALKTTLIGTLTTTGTDADPDDNVAKKPLRILQPRIVAVPDIGKPGFVTLVRGVDFPPGARVRLTWKPGITAAAVPAIPSAKRTFTAQLLILTKDQTGPRTITASGPGFSPVTTPFLVVGGSVGPPDEVQRR